MGQEQDRGHSLLCQVNRGLAAAYLIASQLEGDSDIDGLVDNTDHRAHQ
jgi:hypothetical protein